MSDLCHDCPRRGDCLLADAMTAPERCTYRRDAADAAAAHARMVAARDERRMMNRLVGAIALETGQTPRQVRERLHQGGIRQ